jgi:DNA-binding SARP family transcriptional activator
VYVSHLRKLLGRDRVVTKAPGYVLHVDEDELDVDRFRRLAERADSLRR